MGDHMTKILVLSHGNLAQELCNACFMIAGEQEFITSICLNEEGLEAFETKLTSYFLENKEEPLIILCDLLHGTPYNQVLIKALDFDRLNYQLVSGVNLPMLLALCMGLPQEADSFKCLEQAVAEAHKGISINHSIETSC